MYDISWTLNVQVTSGPKRLASRTISVEAYDPIEVEIPAGSPGDSTADPPVPPTPGTATVDVQPSQNIEQVKFLLIIPSAEVIESIGDDRLTYRVNDLTNDITLDEVQVFMGEGLIELLGEVPQQLVFSNLLTQTVSVQILVGRDAIQPT